MTDLLSDDTDFEMSKYYEARDMIDAGINPAIEKNKKAVFNPETGMNDVLLPMSSGGYVKISEEAPEVMTEAPAQPTMPGASDVAPAQAAAEYAQQLQEMQGSYTLDDLRAAGYNDDQIRAAGLDVIPIPQKRTEALSEQEVSDIIASGQPIITANPTLRDEGSRIVSTYFFDLAVQGLREELAEQGMGADEIERTVKAQEAELFRNAEVYSNALFGTGATGMEIGAGDFLQAGIMDIQEGYRMFQQQRAENGGTVGGRAIGMAIMAAGVAEATGVGYAFGKLLKRGAKALEPTLVRMGDEVEQPAQSPTIRAFHGSGTDFDKFDLSFMGTGEGAQAYGKGLYFAEMEEVAQDYRQKLSGVLSNPLEDVLIPTDASPAAMAKADNDLKQAVAFASTSFSPEGAARDFAAFTGREESPELIEAFRQAMSNKGRLYEVNINADPNELMNFDALISDQPEKVQKVLAPFVERRLDEIEAVGREEVEKAKAKGRDFTPRTRDEILSTLKGGDILLLDKVVTGEVSQALKDAGIPGIKYLDRNSRNKSFEIKLSVDGQPYATEPIFATTRAEANQIVNDYKDKGFDATVTNVGSSNYVVLDDNLIDIVKKYGFGGLMVGAGVQSSLGVKESFEEA